MVYIIGIIILACLPGKQLPSDVSSNMSLCFHFLEYFMLAILLGIWFLVYTDHKPLLSTFSICLLLAIVTEVIQIFVPGRCFGFDDILANLAGFNIAITLFFITAEYIICKIYISEVY